MLGIGFLPSVEHLTNPIIRSAFVSYQRAGSVESAIGTDDDGQDILDIINDLDMLSDMGEHSEFTDTTDIIRPTTHFYNSDAQQEVEYYAMNHLVNTTPFMNLKTSQSTYSTHQSSSKVCSSKTAR
jgi:hypothetical protein